MIGKPAAWMILRRFADDCMALGPQSLMAVYAIGSLGGGYYRPGQSDIDAAVIVEDGSEAIWGTSEEPSKPFEELRRRYKEEFDIPKEMGAFPLQESKLYPPYIPDEMLAIEVVRLKMDHPIWKPCTTRVQPK